MKIQLHQIGKRFNNEWIFRNVAFCFEEKSVTAILGRNGSGKSTLLQIIAGNMHPSEGTVTYVSGGETIISDLVFRHISMVAPYLELIEDFTLQEMLGFHFSFKKYLPGQDQASVTDLLAFPSMSLKPIRQFSSGMKQRMKLALAVFSDVPLILLDEPTMNLDKAGIDWYLETLEKFRHNRTVIICSNLHQTESAFAGQTIRIEDFK